MTMKKYHGFVAGIIVSLLAIPVFAQNQGQQNTQDQQYPQGQMNEQMDRQDMDKDKQSMSDTKKFSASDIIGSSILAQNGDELGTIDNLIIGTDGSIESAVIARGGFLGMGRDNYAIPWNSLRQSSDQEDAFVTSVQSSQLQAVSDTQRQRQTDQWLDKDVVGADDEKLGSLENLYIEDDKVGYVLITGDNDQIHPVPFNMVARDTENDRLVLNIDKSDFDRSPAYDEEAIMEQDSSMWQSSTDAYYDRYERELPVSERIEEMDEEQPQQQRQ